MLNELDDFILINLRVFGDATLSININLVSLKIMTWIKSKYKKPISANVHKSEKSVRHIYNQSYFEYAFDYICFSCFNFPSYRPLYVVKLTDWISLSEICSSLPFLHIHLLLLTVLLQTCSQIVFDILSMKKRLLFCVLI